MRGEVKREEGLGGSSKALDFCKIKRKCPGKKQRKKTNKNMINTGKKMVKLRGKNWKFRRKLPEKSDKKRKKNGKKRVLGKKKRNGEQEFFTIYEPYFRCSTSSIRVLAAFEAVVVVAPRRWWPVESGGCE